MEAPGADAIRNLTGVPDEIFAFPGGKKLTPKYGKVFGFEHIKDAVSSQDEGSADGKTVVKC